MLEKASIVFEGLFGCYCIRGLLKLRLKFNYLAKGWLQGPSMGLFMGFYLGYCGWLIPLIFSFPKNCPVVFFVLFFGKCLWKHVQKKQLILNTETPLVQHMFSFY